MAETESQSPAHAAPPRSCLFFLVGIAAFVAIGLAILLNSIRGSRYPDLTREQYEVSLRHWKSNAPANYRIRTKVEGRQPAQYEVHVRNGIVDSATRNDTPLTQRRTIGTWSVPGMFDTMEYDLRVVEGKNMSEQQRAATDLILRAEFDPNLGYPARYLRSDFVMKTTTRWEVVEFEVLPEEIRNGAPADE